MPTLSDCMVETTHFEEIIIPEKVFEDQEAQVCIVDQH